MNGVKYTFILSQVRYLCFYFTKMISDYVEYALQLIWDDWMTNLHRIEE